MSPPSRARASRARGAALAALFLLSGATALVYEVSWTRRLVLLVGSTSSATALLLAAWMLGLALGARLGGPVSDRSRNPLRLYALLEAGAAGAALLLPAGLDGLGALPPLTAAGREPLLLAAGFLALLVPTTLLGATLPALSRAVADDPGEAGVRVGLLYAANTLGAVAGALSAGFFLVEALGVDGSARASVAANLLVAGAAWLLSRGRDAPAEEDAPAPAPGPDPAAARAAAAAAFAAGFVGLASEVAWTRLLVFTMQGFTAAFSAMLGAFLLGSALGGAFFARVAARSRDPVLLLGRIQVGAAIAAAAALAFLRHHYGFVQAIRGPLSPFESARANHDLLLVVSALAVVGPPAFLMGGVFTAAVGAAAGGTAGLGARVGRLYAANTVGAVLGALAAGFVGLPLAGARDTAALAAAASLLAGAATLARARGGLRPVPLGAAAAAVLALALLARPLEPMILRSVVFLGPRGAENELIEAREGRTGVASVVRNVRNGYTSLYTDEFLAASTEGRYRYMRMLGHIPMVLAEDPRRVLVMAFGTGTTAGSLSTHPGVETLDIVEISPEVLDVAPHFEPVNRGVVARAGWPRAPGAGTGAPAAPAGPAVRLHVEDARRFVLANPGPWDVVTLEPLLPYTPGAVHLYTREFYALCRERLAPGGAMCQWFPIHALSSDDFRSLAAAFLEVFPESSLWFVEETAALVGTNGPQGTPVARSARRLSVPGPLEDLKAGGLDDLAQWWSFRVCGGKALREWTRGVRPLVDEHPDLEFRPIPSGTLTTYLHDNLVVALDLRDAERGEPGLDLSGLDPAGAAAFGERAAAAAEATAAYMDGRASEDVFGFHASHTRLERGAAEVAAHERAAAEALGAAVRRYGDAVRLNPRDRIVAERWRNVESLRLLNAARALLARGRAPEAVEAYREAAAIGAPWNRDETWTGLGRALLRDGRPSEALEALEKAVAIYAGNRDAQALAGQALVALGRGTEAAERFARAYAGGGGPADEDGAMREARAIAEAGGAGGPPPDPAREWRRLLEAAAGPRGPARDGAVARLRGAAGRDAEILRGLLDGTARAAEDPSAPPADRVRALALLAAAGDPRLGPAALAAAASAEPALAAAAVDAAAEGGAGPLVPLLDPARVPAAPVRSRAADRLASIRDRRAVDAALDALGDPDEGVRSSAHAALFQLTGRKEFDPGAPEPERAAAAAALREWWRTASPSWR